MFDRVTIQQGKEAVPYAKTVTVHEHRAPTDDSIRLYQEIAYIFTLNGREITGKITIKHHEALTLDRQGIVRKIVEDASRHIAVEILQHMTGL